MSKHEEQKHSQTSILLIVSSYAPNLGGLQSVTRTLARGLSDKGYRVAVITQRYPRALKRRELIDDLSIDRLFFLTPNLGDLLRGRLGLFAASLFFFPITLFSLTKRIRFEKPGIVNLHFAGAPTLFVLIAHWLLGFNLVVSLHGDDIEGLAQHGRFRNWATRKLLQRANVVTACSQHLLNEAAAVDPTVAHKGRVIHNGIDLPLPQTQKAGQAEFVCAVGRMVHKKGFDVLLRALPYTDTKLRLIGRGPEREALKALAAELNLNDRAEFLEVADQAGVISMMAASRAVVIPSRQEPFGIVALEAMAAGKPIVATRAGGLPEVLEGADAVLVPPDDSREMANGIALVLERLNQEPSFGACNRVIAAGFTTARMVNQYAAVYAGTAGTN